MISFETYILSIIGIIIIFLLVFIIYTINRIRCPYHESSKKGKWFEYRYKNFYIRLEEIIGKYEIEYDTELTPTAREMLIIPILELQERIHFIDWNQIKETLKVIMSYMKRYPSEKDKHEKKRSALSLIKAFWGKYCNIPPLCAERDKKQEDSNVE